MVFLFAQYLMCNLWRFYYFAGFITSASTFMMPLSADEEKMYLDLYRNGDKSARDILIERNLRLVAHVAKKYSQSPQEQEDIISIGTIGLIKGINTFDSKKGTRLSTYVAKCIDNEILMSFRGDKKAKNDILLNDPVGTDKEGNELTLIEKISAEGDSIYDEVSLKMQVCELYNKIKECLVERERDIIMLRYGLSGGEIYTQNEIAKMMNISRSYVSRIEKKAIEKLRYTMDTDQ